MTPVTARGCTTRSRDRSDIAVSIARQHRRRRRAPRTILRSCAWHVAEVVATREPVVLVCGEPRCPMGTSFYFGFEPPGHLTVVNADQFAAAPLPAHARVRLVTQMIRALGAAREPARIAEELGLPRITWHPEVRLYDAGDGARLQAALARGRSSTAPLSSVRPSPR